MEHGLYWNCVTTCDDIKSSHHLGCQHVDHLLSENSTCLSPFPVTPSLLGQRRQTRNVRTGSSHHLIGTLCQDGLSIAVQLQMPCTMLYGWNVGIAWVLDIETHGSNSLQRWERPMHPLQTSANMCKLHPDITQNIQIFQRKLHREQAKGAVTRSAGHSFAPSWTEHVQTVQTVLIKRKPLLFRTHVT